MAEGGCSQIRILPWPVALHRYFAPITDLTHRTVIDAFNMARVILGAILNVPALAIAAYESVQLQRELGAGGGEWREDLAGRSVRMAARMATTTVATPYPLALSFPRMRVPLLSRGDGNTDGGHGNNGSSSDGSGLRLGAAESRCGTLTRL